MRVLHLESDCYPSESMDLLKRYFEVTCLDVAGQDHFINHLLSQEYDIIFTRLGLFMGGRVFDTQPSLKKIVTPTTGLNHLDLVEAQKRGIEIISLKGEYEFLSTVKSTAEHTWALLLALIRNLIPAQQSVKEGKWDRVPYLANELNTKTIGIIGLGRLGKILVKYSEAFSLNILCNDVDPSKFTQEYTSYKSSLDELLAKSDFLILQIDYRPENKHFFDRKRFSSVKKGAYFINTSRGELVDEKSLLHFLKIGHLKGAALDVLEGDSSWHEHAGKIELIDYAKSSTNLIITPHMGGYGKTSIEMTREFVTNKLISNAL